MTQDVQNSVTANPKQPKTSPMLEFSNIIKVAHTFWVLSNVTKITGGLLGKYTMMFLLFQTLRVLPCVLVCVRACVLHFCHDLSKTLDFMVQVCNQCHWIIKQNPRRWFVHEIEIIEILRQHMKRIKLNINRESRMSSKYFNF